MRGNRTVGHDVAVANAERNRLAEADHYSVAWRRWGPYLSERAWGTVREDYSPGGDAWSFFPFDQAGSRTYRWSEDGLGGICDEDQTICLALALWNGADPILKERAFGLTGEEGNHGEDVKECWWYLDATPTSSYLKWRYHYPQAAFPYDDLRATNRARSRLEPEYELADTGVFDEGRYWIVEAEWAKAAPEDLVWRITVTNQGREPATLDVLPTIWYRNRWSWTPGSRKPSLTLRPATPDGPPAPDVSIVADHFDLGRWVLSGASVDGVAPEVLFCENESNATKLWGNPGPAYPKDGIGDHVVHGAATVNPDNTGTKAALRYHLSVDPGASATLTLHFRREGAGAVKPDAVFAERKTEADEFYDELAPTDATQAERRILRQAAAGMLWSKQFFHYDVHRWLSGDPSEPPPPAERLKGRNSGWVHLSNRDVISMPDPWEYPWYAAWDLSFHCVALAHLDSTFAKEQLILLCREWYMHPNGQLPAYEWNFSDVNPPVHAWAALRVWQIERDQRAMRGEAPDDDFLERIFHKLLLNFSWWVNRKDEEGNNVFEGGFLGLDNIGVFDRSKPLPVPGRLEQSDGTAWMAMYCLNLLEIAMILARHDPTYEDVALKFFEHFAYIAQAAQERGLWDEEDGFFYDVIRLDDGTAIPVRVVSMVGVIATFAVTAGHRELWDDHKRFTERAEWFVENRPLLASSVHYLDAPGATGGRMLSMVSPQQLSRILTRVLDPEQLLSDHGVRSLSRRHGSEPVSIEVGGQTATVDYEPAESTNYLFGGNSNWRGPIWFPLNYLLIEALDRFGEYLGDDFTVEDPVGDGKRLSLHEVSNELARRLISLFVPGPDGHRPVAGDSKLYQEDPAWRDLLWFHEYFHGDTGAGLGASHQTGWTGLVLDLIADRRLGGRS